MLLGIREEKPSLLLPYLLSHSAVILCCVIGTLVYLNSLLEEQDLRAFFILTFVLFLLYVWMAYCLLVVRTLYLQMTRSSSKNTVPTILCNPYAQERLDEFHVQVTRIAV
ncbi:hypothetical protein SK128_015261 [Halocaridina rubra]|uniref:Uncharacterized protein n=1 Tax=Halocaridina rubra TaxID=373956 RepID=A0AAN9A6P3_HALRR